MSDTPIIDTFRTIEALLTADGAAFETTEVDIGGQPIRTYRQLAPNLADILADFERRFADRPLLAGDETRSYRDVFADARNLAGALHRKYGVGRGDRIGIMMANQPAFVVSLIAIARLGAVAVLYNSRGSSTEIAAALADVPSAVVIADPQRIELLRTIDQRAELVSTQDGVAETISLRTLTDGAQDAPAFHAEPGDLCMILFTSGTSGRAKGVLLTQRNIGNVIRNMQFVTECNVHLAAHQYGISIDDIRHLAPPTSALLIFPLFHVSGLAALFSVLSSGGRVATMTRWNPETAAALICEHRLTLMSGPPMAVDELLRLPDARDRLASLVNVTPGGQATPPNLTARVQNTLPTAQRSAGWGMTETGGSVCTAGGALLQVFPHTAGPMSPIMEVRVTDAGGAALAPNTVGEFELRGGQVMAGYVGAGPHRGWLRTGDLGYLDDHGLVHIVDRSKDIVISAGENISCSEIEATLMATESFAEVAAFGIPDDRRGERLVVAVTLEAGQVLDAEQVRDLAGRTLPAYKIPSEVLFDQSPLPRNATGKILKRELRARFLAARTPLPDVEPGAQAVTP